MNTLDSEERALSLAGPFHLARQLPVKELGCKVNNVRRIAATLAVGIVLLIAMLAAIEAGIGWALRMPRLAMPQPSEVEVVQFSSREGAKMDAFVAETSNADEIAAFLNLIEAQNTGWKKTWLPFPGPDHRFMIHGPEGTLIVWLGKE